MVKTFVLVLVVFIKILRPVLGLNKGLTLRLVGGRLKQVLNMAHALTNAHFSFTNGSKLVKIHTKYFKNYFLGKMSGYRMFFQWKNYPFLVQISKVSRQVSVCITHFKKNWHM